MTKNREDLNDMMTLLLEWVEEVGRIHLSKFRQEMVIETKTSRADVVTEVDKACEKYLVEQIESHFPSHSILGEESGAHSHSSEWLWIIDPVDGTNNYSQGLPYFSVTVGVQHLGETVLGVVFAPYLNELFSCIKGQGAFLNGKPIALGKKTELADCIIATGFPSDKGTNPDNNADNVLRILPHLRCLRRFGGAALDLCYTAAGFLDGFWELNINIWDIAAGVLILEEVGGKIVFLREDGSRRLCPVASNPVVLPQMMQYLR